MSALIFQRVWTQTLILFFLLTYSSFIFAEKIALKALSIRYVEDHKIMIASGNAELSHPSFKLTADTIYYNQATNVLTGKNNVELLQNNQLILSDAFEFDSSTNQLFVDNLMIEIQGKSNNQIFVTADKFTDHITHKSGTSAIITTCEDNPPHYHFSAKSFVIYPNKRLIAKDVTLVNPIFFIPFGFWSPAYIFDMGKRKIIYLLPEYGTNAVDGAFLKNKFDYIVSDNFYGTARVDTLSKRGIGFGSKLNYDSYEGREGYLDLYGIMDSGGDEMEWFHKEIVSDNATFRSKVSQKNSKLYSGRTSQTSQQVFTYMQNKINETSETSYQFNQTKSSLTTKRFQANHKVTADNGNTTSIHANHSRSLTNQEQVTLMNTQTIGYDVTASSELNFQQQDISASDRRNESTLRAKNNLTKTFDGQGTLTTVLDMSFDTDGDTVTSDIRNRVVQITPEITYTFNPFKVSNEWTFNQTIQYGYYTEKNYITSINQPRELSSYRVNIKESIIGKYHWQPFNTNLTSKWSYNQFSYGTGDQSYSLSHTGTLTNTWLPFLESSTSHIRQWNARESNSPFYFDAPNNIEKNLLNETITLFYKSPTKYKLSVTTGFDYLRSYQLDNKYELLINPNTQFNANLKTTYYIRQFNYSPLSSSIRWRPSDYFSTDLNANYDLNIGKFESISHTYHWITSRTWENKWTISAKFLANPKLKKDYKLQTMSVTKDLHRRQFTIKYNRILEEFRFQFSINAVPENTVGFKTNEQEPFKLEGSIDGQTLP
tara:strand:+ start:521 stop:2830 length:2310 start_codon:yes stop_codon:yes gene_type:complete